MHVVARLKAPTPKFFKALQLFGIGLATVSATIMAAPEMPAPVVDVAGYLALAGGVVSAVCQTAVTEEPDTSETEPYDEYEP